MFTLYRNTSPASTRAKLSRKLTRPSRIAFTSVPRSAMPASNVSRTGKSVKALWFSAMLACASSRSVFSVMKRFRVFVVSRSTRLPLRGSRQARRKQHGGDHTLGIGHAWARDVERGAMIDRRADDRQPEGHIHRLAECEQLDGNQPL